MLHIAKSDIIEFNVVKWFGSGEYLIHTQKTKERWVCVPYVCEKETMEKYLNQSCDDKEPTNACVYVIVLLCACVYNGWV